MASTGNQSPLFAAIDFGANNFELTIARSNHIGWETVCHQKIQIGWHEPQHMWQDNAFSDEMLQKALAAVEVFQKHLSKYDIEAAQAVGTSALRQAVNAKDFLEPASEILGQTVDVISGEQEAALIYQATVPHFNQDRLHHRKAKQVVIDIGGGSTEVAFGDNSELLTANSYAIGCLALAKKYFSGSDWTAENFASAEHEAALFADLLKEEIGGMTQQRVQAYGISGAFEAIAECLRTLHPELSNAPHITLTQHDICNLLGRVNTRSSILLSTVPEYKRPLLPGALCIIDAVFSALNITAIRVVPASLAQGVLMTLASANALWQRNSQVTTYT